MKRLIVGFDSAWTPRNSGAIVGLLQIGVGKFRELGEPNVANFAQAQEQIETWQENYSPDQTVVFIDQPTIVNNNNGSRPAEKLIASPVSRRYGGVQPASKARAGMFDDVAPIWPFLGSFGGAADPLMPLATSSVFECYPVLTIINLGWTLPDPGGRETGRLPKYNPSRSTFTDKDWRHVCCKAAEAFESRELDKMADRLRVAGQLHEVLKAHQDRLDACICLLAAVLFIEGNGFMMVGNLTSGYIVAPDNEELRTELVAHCIKKNWNPSDWIHAFHLTA